MYLRLIVPDILNIYSIWSLADQDPIYQHIEQSRQKEYQMKSVSLREYFPMLRTRDELMNEISSHPGLQKIFNKV